MWDFCPICNEDTSVCQGQCQTFNQIKEAEDTMTTLNIPSQGRVRDPDDYYRKELKTYTNWRMAWIREAAQNSIDAGATLIKVSIKPGKEKITDHYGDLVDSCFITWEDNGSGLYRLDSDGNIVLFSKYLVLGESEKTSTNIGGFGWAKKLLAFAMGWYEIHSGNIVLKGKGGEWEAEESDTFVDGTRLIVHAPADQFEMRKALADWAKWSSTDTVIKLDGAKVKTFSDTMKHKGKASRAFDWADINNVDDSSSNIVVRIGGQQMFRWWGPEEMKNSVTLDIKSSDSTKFLTTNRDGMVYQYKQDINAWLKKLHRDPKSIEVLENRKVMRFGGNKGFIKLDGMTSAERDEQRDIEIQRLLDNPDAFARAMRKMKDSQAEFGDAIYDGFNMTIISTISKEIPKRFMPRTMTAPSIRMMTWWASIITLVGDIIKHSGVITPGWYFKPDARACWNRKGRTGDGAMLINPVNIDIKTGKMTNRLDNSRDCFNKMVVECAHEFTHAKGYSWHNDDFVAKNADIMGMVLNAQDRFDALWANLRGI